MFRKAYRIAFIALLVAPLVFIASKTRKVFAQTTIPATTAAYATNNYDWDFVPWGHDCDSPWDFRQEIVNAQIKPPAGQSDLLVGISMTSGLFTDAIKASWDDNFTFAIRNSGIVVCAVLDGNTDPNNPPQCVLWNDHFTFDATFLDDVGMFSKTFQAQLLAQTYNVGFSHVGPGVHTVDVDACFMNEGFEHTFGAGFSDTDVGAAFGPATLTINAVNLKQMNPPQESN